MTHRKGNRHLLESEHSAETRLQKAERHRSVQQQQIASVKKHVIHLPGNSAWSRTKLIHTRLAEDIEKKELSDAPTTVSDLTQSNLD